MNALKNKLRTKSFWMSLAAGVILILQSLGVKINVPIVNEAMSSVCTVLMLLGIFTAPTAGDSGNIDDGADGAGDDDSDNGSDCLGDGDSDSK